MDAETIQNTLISLGRQDFRSVASVLLRDVFGLNAVNVDGPYDGGTDWRVFKGSGGTSTVAFQDTVKAAGWEEKAVGDAKKAVHKSGATRYFFLSPRAYSALTLRRLETKITTELNIPATCLSAREISQFIVEAGLTKAFLDAINAPLVSGIADRPDRREVLLHAYTSLSADTYNHQTEIYDESLLLATKLSGVSGASSKESLVAATIALLACPSERAPRLASRVDVLLSRRHLRMTAEKKIVLDTAVAQEIESSERLYLKEFESLEAAQTALVAKNFGLVWTKENAERVSVLLSRLFVKTQLDGVGDAGVTISAPGLVKNLGEPLQDLRDYLRKTGIAVRQVQDVLDELVRQAKDLPLIKKLTRAAVYVSLEGADPVSSAKAIGAPRWSDVNVMLDASVAIPYICSRLYRPASGTFFNASFQAVGQLEKVGCQLRISWNYVEECASHLLRALQYQALRGFDGDLQYSQNAYVANYYRLRKQGVRVPPNIRDYLVTFSSAINYPDRDSGRWVRSIMPDMQKMLNEYGVDFESAVKVPAAIRKSVEVEYTYKLEEMQRKKAPMLIYHDVDTLSHIKRQISQKGEHWVTLTWDRSMISVGQKEIGCGWVVSPEVALDFVQPYKALSEVDLCAVAHRIARIREGPMSLTAHVLDRVIDLAGDKLQDWEINQELGDFRDELLGKIDFGKAGYADWVDVQTDEFLAKLKVREEKREAPKKRRKST